MLTNTRLNDYKHWGRFGNQMFLIASCLGIADRNNMRVKLPYWTYQRYFLHDLPALDYGLPFINRMLIEPDYYYHEFNLDTSLSYDMRGYFQSWKYFSHCEDKIRYYLEMELPERNDMCAIHVRRGDYLSFRGVYPILSETDYYTKAIQEYDSGQRFLIFSDDIEWCISHFKGPRFEFSIGHNEINDFALMQSCEHVIIANSTFSWWAAWLNKNPNKKIVAPEFWILTETRTDDRIPPEWIQKGV